MKHDWEYKKLGEVCGFRRGSFPQPYGEPKWFDGENAMPFVQVADMQDDNFDLVSNTKNKISQLAQPFSVFVPKGIVLVSLQGSIGKVAITQYDCYVDRTVAIFNQLNEAIWNKKFFAYSIKTIFEEKRKIARGISIKTITKEEFSDFECAVPPLPTQQSIVSELDSLSKIIADCKETLKDYDALEQSIFYDMFGDPVKNEKGWEVKKLGECCKVISGFAFPSNDFSEHNEIKAVKITNVGVKEFVFDNMSLPSSYLTKSDYILYEYDIVIALTRSVISTGFKRAYVPFEYDKSLLNQRVAALKIPNLELRTFIYNYLGSDFVKNYVMEKATALMQPNLSIGDLKNMPIFYPTNQLLQQFASKIEAIEQMKTETKKALQEAETLFNARMDYWFN